MNILITLILIALVVIALLCYKHFFLKEHMNHYKNNPTHVLLKNKDKKINNITNTIKKKQNNSTSIDTVADTVADTATDEDIGLIIRGITQHKLKKDISIESLLE
tara:strand:- start:103 stop:417 length:315 start_codon:yes stop_codon:yes gene_type:complete